MSYFYASDKLKSICQAVKYNFGTGFMIVNYLVDELGERGEKKFFREAVPIDINKTSEIFPCDIETISDLRSLLEDLKEISQEFTKNS